MHHAGTGVVRIGPFWVPVSYGLLVHVWFAVLGLVEYHDKDWLGRTSVK